MAVVAPPTDESRAQDMADAEGVSSARATRILFMAVGRTCRRSAVGVGIARAAGSKGLGERVGRARFMRGMAEGGVAKGGSRALLFRGVVIPVFDTTLANRDSPKRKGEVWAGDSFEGVGRGLANEGERGRWFF